MQTISKMPLIPRQEKNVKFTNVLKTNFNSALYWSFIDIKGNPRIGMQV